MASIMEVAVSVVIIVVVVVASDALHPLNVLSRGIPVGGGCRPPMGIHIGVVAPLILLIVVVVGAIAVIVVTTSVVAVEVTARV